MRTLVYYVACTVDGFIARPDGSFDGFLAEGAHLADLAADFPETFPAPMREAFGARGENREFGAVLMGRHTYEVGLSVGLTSPYPQLDQYVLSRTMRESPDPAVTLRAGDAVALVRELKGRPGKAIWLCGGGELAGQLLPEIDEFILKVNPVVFGAGIPLFGAAGAAAPVRLTLTERRAYDNGFMRLRYRPERAGAA